tara:strand:+ start:176 stop:760 length:585 start_codon:yes stop_codon:yes gene_type:complete
MTSKKFPNLNTTISGRDFNISTKWDFGQVDRALNKMERDAGKSMANAIKEVLRREMGNAQSDINSSVRPRHRIMGQRVADSLAVETLGDAGSEAEVRAGSDPMDDFGVEGSRGGKLALILEFGIRDFQYPFTFKTIKNSPSWGSGGSEGGFINTKGGNMTYKGFDGIGWLDKAYNKSVPQIEQAILQALAEDFA